MERIHGVMGLNEVIGTAYRTVDMIGHHIETHVLQMQVGINIDHRIITVLHQILIVKLSGSRHIGRYIVRCMITHIGAYLKGKHVIEGFGLKIEIVIETDLRHRHH